MIKFYISETLSNQEAMYVIQRYLVGKHGWSQFWLLNQGLWIYSTFWLVHWGLCFSGACEISSRVLGCQLLAPGFDSILCFGHLGLCWTASSVIHNSLASCVWGTYPREGDLKLFYPLTLNSSSNYEPITFFALFLCLGKPSDEKLPISAMILCAA